MSKISLLLLFFLLGSRTNRIHLTSSRPLKTKELYKLRFLLRNHNQVKAKDINECITHRFKIPNITNIEVLIISAITSKMTMGMNIMISTLNHNTTSQNKIKCFINQKEMEFKTIGQIANMKRESTA